MKKNGILRDKKSLNLLEAAPSKSAKQQGLSVQQASSTQQVLSAVPEQTFESQKICVDADNAALIKQWEESILKSKVQLADIELHLAEMQVKKTDLVETIKNQNAAMFSQIRLIAQSFGIDVDGISDDRKWNFSTSDMVFRRTK